MGLETGFTSAVRIAIHVRVSYLCFSLPSCRVIDICRYYGAAVPSFLSITTAVGFNILNNIVGGQALSSIANVSWTCVVTALYAK